MRTSGAAPGAATNPNVAHGCAGQPAVGTGRNALSSRRSRLSVCRTSTRTMDARVIRNSAPSTSSRRDASSTPARRPRCRQPFIRTTRTISPTGRRGDRRPRLHRVGLDNAGGLALSGVQASERVPTTARVASGSRRDRSASPGAPPEPLLRRPLPQSRPLHAARHQAAARPLRQ